MIYRTVKPLILASHSPRRREYLQDLGLKFDIRGADVDETVMPGESADDYVRRVALEKAEAVQQIFPARYVLAADTAVCVGEHILGKPQNAREAVAMLLSLAGREHVVRTGFCICCAAENVQNIRVVATSVRFLAFDEGLARAYVSQGESLDKAGAYGIQGQGAFLVERISGSYSNVVGLPLAEVVHELVRYGVVVPAG